MKAIDVHVHPSTAAFDRGKMWGPEMVEYISKYYGVEYKVKKDEEMAQDFRELDLKAILIGWDTESVSGFDTSSTNDEVARLIKKFPDVFIGGWAMIDPWKGKAAIKELERCVKELGLMGLKFQQALQAFFPNDRRFYPLYEKCVELGIPVNFHTGPWYYPLRSKYSHPMYLDDVAVDFPELTLHCTHSGDLLFMEMIGLAKVYTNIILDLAAWQGWLRASRPTVTSFYKTMRFMIDIVGPRLMFASDWGGLIDDTAYCGWVKAFTVIPGWVNEAGIEFTKEELDGYLYKNALKLLKLG